VTSILLPLIWISIVMLSFRVISIGVKILVALQAITLELRARREQTHDTVKQLERLEDATRDNSDVLKDIRDATGQAVANLQGLRLDIDGRNVARVYGG
jgi:hypothetical protein